MILFFLLWSFTLGALENSVVPLVLQWEQIENLPKEKYSTMQLKEIESALQHKEESLRIATYNVLSNHRDSEKLQKERWVSRLPGIVELLQEMEPDILGIQELYPEQYSTLMPYLEQEYQFFGQPCDDDEWNGIFYRKERFKLVKSQVWDMQGTTLTMVQLSDQQTGKSFAVFNTHLAFSKVEKRAFQARFIGERVKEVSKTMPVFLTGDMNTFTQRPELEKLPFYDGDYVQRQLMNHVLHDAKELSLLGHFGPISTFTNGRDDGIPFTGTGTPGIFLDHIFVSEGVTVLIHAVQVATKDGHFPSDHMPLFIDVTVKD